MPVRACRCSFCRKHGTRTVSDPTGRLEIRVARESDLIRYRFGTRTADFLVCGRCGVYVGAICESAGAVSGIVNVNVLDESHRFTAPAEPRDRGGETPAERLGRRQRTWTPCRFYSSSTS